MTSLWDQILHWVCVEWLLPWLGGTGFESRLGWPFISYHRILVCVNNDLNGSLRINSRLHARLNSQISHPYPISPSICLLNFNSPGRIQTCQPLTKKLWYLDLLIMRWWMKSVLYRNLAELLIQRGDFQFSKMLEIFYLTVCPEQTCWNVTDRMPNATNHWQPKKGQSDSREG